MRRQLIYWKPVRSQNIYGETYLNRYFPQLINQASNGALVFEILSMKVKTPISFEYAVNLADEESFRASNSGRSGYEPGQSHWYYRNFVKWISEQGYHIELTGDEFETAAMCSYVA